MKYVSPRRLYEIHVGSKGSFTLETDSRVDIRVRILSTMPRVADSAGTKLFCGGNDGRGSEVLH